MLDLGLKEVVRKTFRFIELGWKQKLKAKNLCLVCCGEMKYDEVESSSDQQFSEEKPSIVHEENIARRKAKLRK